MNFKKRTYCNERSSFKNGINSYEKIIGKKLN